MLLGRHGVEDVVRRFDQVCVATVDMEDLCASKIKLILLLAHTIRQNLDGRQASTQGLAKLWPLLALQTAGVDGPYHVQMPLHYQSLELYLRMVGMAIHDPLLGRP